MLLLGCISEICQCLWCVQLHVWWHRLKNERHSCELFGRQWQTYLAKQGPEGSISRVPAEAECVTRHPQFWAVSAQVLLEGWMAVGLSSLLGFPSVTCGTKCLQAPSRWPWRAFLHSFQIPESRVVVLWFFIFDNLCAVGSLLYLGHVLLIFLDNLCVARTCCRAQQTQQNPRLWSIPKAMWISAWQFWLEQVAPCTSAAPFCWVQMFALVTRVGFLSQKSRGAQGQAGFGFGQPRTRLPQPAGAVVLCLPHPIQRDNW